MRVIMVRCIFLVFFMVITTISSYGQNEEQKMMGEAKLKEESLLTRDTLSGSPVKVCGLGIDLH